jgi:hypothetical protein
MNGNDYLQQQQNNMFTQAQFEGMKEAKRNKIAMAALALSLVGTVVYVGWKWGWKWALALLVTYALVIGGVVAYATRDWSQGGVSATANNPPASAAPSVAKAVAIPKVCPFATSDVPGGPSGEPTCNSAGLAIEPVAMAVTNSGDWDFTNIAWSHWGATSALGTDDNGDDITLSDPVKTSAGPVFTLLTEDGAQGDAADGETLQQWYLFPAQPVATAVQGQVPYPQLALPLSQND